MNRSIGILGCGWLGFELAKSLLADGFIVKGTTTREEKIDKLQAAGVIASILSVQDQEITGDIDTFLENVQTLFIDIPPGLRKDPTTDFVGNIEIIMKKVQKAQKVTRVIFVSSTSVYEDKPEFPAYSSVDAPNATSVSGKKIAAAELIVQQYHSNTTILRPGGLIGSDRNPITMLAGKKDLKNASAPVNLVNRDYLIEVIISLIKSKEQIAYRNVISEPQVSRKVYYTEQAVLHGLEIPTFQKNDIQLGKIIKA